MQQLALDVSAHDVISTPSVLQAVTTKKAIAPVAELPNRKPSEAIGTGSLTEMILSENSTIHPVQMLPLLAQCDTHTRWLMWLSPNRTINKTWLTKMGLEKAPIIHLDTCADTQKTLCSRILNAANSHMIIEWQGELSNEDRDLLQEEAIKSGTHIILAHRI